MNATLRRKANAIARKYCGWKLPQEIVPMYAELDAIGISVGMLLNRRDNYAGSWSASASVEINGQDVTNSIMVFDCYEGNASNLKNEYNIYFS